MLLRQVLSFQVICCSVFCFLFYLNDLSKGTKSFSASTVNVGQTFSMTIVVSANMPSNTGLRTGFFNDTLPSGLRFTSSTPVITQSATTGQVMACGAASFATLPCSVSVLSSCNSVLITDINTTANQVRTCTYVFSVIATASGVQTNPDIIVTANRTVTSGGSTTWAMTSTTIAQASVAVVTSVTATKSFSTVRSSFFLFFQVFF